MDAPEYLQLKPGDVPPRFGRAYRHSRRSSFIDADVTPDWQGQSKWTGSSDLAVDTWMAWGKACGDWGYQCR